MININKPRVTGQSVDAPAAKVTHIITSEDDNQLEIVVAFLDGDVEFDRQHFLVDKPVGFDAMVLAQLKSLADFDQAT